MLQFKPLDCRKRRNIDPKFVPIAHDLITVNQRGEVQIAENTPAVEIINYLNYCNNSCTKDTNGVDNSPVLTLIRFEEAGEDTVVEEPQSSHHGSSTNNEWSQLWPTFNCSNPDNGDLEFQSKPRYPRSPCHASEVTATNADGLVCRKLSYNINLHNEKRITLSNHFHKINGEARAMARMTTCNLELEIVKEIIGKTLMILKNLYSETGSNNMESLIPVPHPKTIIWSILDIIEDKSSKALEQHRRYLEKEIESDISKQRDPKTTKPNGLEINYIILSETIVKLSDIKQKLQKMDYLMSLIATIEDSKGNPKACKLAYDNGSATSEDLEIPENRICHEWKKQLGEVNIRLPELKKRCQQHSLTIEVLQSRVKGILNIVSILRAEREKQRSENESIQIRLAQERHLKTLNYQASMLKKQEIIVAQTKRDNTVMKVIAVLTALFLPGTFIATVFSVPVFQWNQENPIGPHFKVYWYFTIPITTVLVVGFSVWFLKMKYDDDREEKRRELGLLEYPERIRNCGRTKSF